MPVARMPRRRLVSCVCVIAAVTALGLRLAAQPPAAGGPVVEIPIQEHERWYVGVISDAHRFPLGRDSAPYEIELLGNTAGNQVQPLLLSTAGRFIWSEEPFRLSVARGTITLTPHRGQATVGQPGTSLRDAAAHASRTFFPAAGRTPDPLLFTHPQFNTWIELTYDQNQKDVLAYARAIVANGFPPGVLMIDEGWAEGYGEWEFHRGRFPDPKGMMDELHRLGFKVMLWVVPYIQPDGKQFAALTHDRRRTVWLRSAPGSREPALMRWWNGYSAVVDVTNPQGAGWLTAQLQQLVADYGVDGFKLDGGDADLFAASAMVNGVAAHDAAATPNRLSEEFARLGLAFPLNEYRATWKMGGQPLAQRLRDKEHTWDDLRKLVPGMLALGLMGYPFACPDMIGGGEYLSFRNTATIDEELIVRGAQVHALMPMMQFSVAPWRVLSPANLSIVRRMAALHQQFGGEILDLSRAAARTGEPIVRPLEYAWPNSGYVGVSDQFLVGADIMVTPVVEKGARQRGIAVPPGRWQGDDGQVVQGPASIEIQVPLERLPWFRRVSRE